MPVPSNDVFGAQLLNIGCCRGLDILFDGRSDRAKKFVLHTNPPGHADFGLYLKCSFKLSLQPRCSGAAPVEDQSIRDSDSSDAAQPADELHCVAQGETCAS